MGLEHRFEQKMQRALHDAVAHAGNGQRTKSTVPLGDRGPSHRAWNIVVVSQILYQPVYFRAEMGGEGLHAHVVATRPAGTAPYVGPARQQGGLVIPVSGKSWDFLNG